MTDVKDAGACLGQSRCYTGPTATAIASVWVFWGHSTNFLLTLANYKLHYVPRIPLLQDVMRTEKILPPEKEHSLWVL
jgi:hypothetical protein